MPRRPDSSPLSRAAIESLLRWRPVLERLVAQGVTARYPPEIEEFFVHLQTPPWVLYEYDPRQSAAWLADADFVAAANWDEVRAMLTACARGERFSDGWWAAVMRDGRLFRVLDRVRELGEG